MRMWGISKRSATARLAASETQPSCCSWTRHRIEIAADAWRPGGYFAISFLAQARFSSVNVKLAGCNSFGARRRTDISSHLSLHAAPGTRVKRVDPVLPEHACGAEHVVTDVGRNLDAIEDRQFGDGLHSASAASFPKCSATRYAADRCRALRKGSRYRSEAAAYRP